ncbi:MAG TPA: DUF885 domain-containing protein [Gemmatimonadales bacterium]|jgi:uncharacterized protein (DUF885 family)|nr:DUF885 domain-containing protein [Gemmatimonadales bacterium]
MPSVDELCRSYLDLKYHFDPAAASSAGLVAHDGRLGDFTPDAVRAHIAALRSVAGAVEELDVAELQDEVDRTALLGELRGTVYRLEHERPHQRNPVFWVNHLFQGLYAVLARSDGAAGGRAPAALERLRAVPGFLDAARATLAEPPSVFVDSALAMLGGGGELIVQLAATLGAEAPGLADDLRAAAGAALEGLKRFGTALRDEIEPDADPHAFAIGEEQFARRLHFEHAVEAGAPELWRYGLRLQEETTAKLSALAAELGPRPWRELVDALRDDVPGPDELLRVYRQELDRARDFVVERDLALVPSTPVDVVATPSFLAALVPFAAYEPPPIYLPAQRGRFYVTRPDPSLPPEAAAQVRRGHCSHGIPAMVVHEAYPGHHLQLVTAQELGSEVRRHLWTPVMVEGWALYCEQLMDETGYYCTPEQRVFQLVNLLWRAIRIVLDVGLHTRGMTTREAVDYMVEHLPIERRSAEAEVRRYCAWPTYQLCYAVGRRELLRLRDDFREAAGDAFEPRRFHDALMRYGGLPVSLARWGMGLEERS